MNVIKSLGRARLRPAVKGRLNPEQWRGQVRYCKSKGLSREKTKGVKFSGQGSNGKSQIPSKGQIKAHTRDRSDMDPEQGGIPSKGQVKYKDAHRGQRSREMRTGDRSDIAKAKA